ncbi:hypothetical protein [Algoriphagus sp.]|uniref:hypothetical protein n=1 Tax=Algoriphagus sp. TaxID=1872435 RepID=UPI00262FE96A|nr:hypothetical protein [Algoriphagus sp.]
MKVIRFSVLLILLTMSSCESWLQDIGLKDIQRFDGPCSIVLSDGSLVETPYSIEVTIRTEAITYRDEEGKLWSLFREDYESFSCGGN